MKFKTYDGGDLFGLFDVSRKIDGVQVTIDSWSRTALSKSGKPLYNFEHIFDIGVNGTFEVYRKGWDTSVSLVRTKINGQQVQVADLYQIGEYTDPSLIIGTYSSLSEKDIKRLFEIEHGAGYEGLIIHEVGTDVYYKVKEVQTHDVMVQSVIEGKGKHAGRLGAVLTSMGKVGGGFSDAQREEFWKDPTFIGAIIECKCMEVTKNGMMRLGRFVRRRYDKS